MFMSKPESTATVGSLEECVDEMNEFIASLTRYPDIVIAHALQVQLGALLRVLLESGRCTPAQAREFLADLEREAL